jgi:WD40 repeat protein
LLKRPAHIIWIDIYQDYWLVQDGLGALWKYYPESDKRDLIFTFNAGKFTDLAVSPLNNCLVTTGFDGCVRLWDYGNKK